MILSDKDDGIFISPASGSRRHRRHRIKSKETPTSDQWLRTYDFNDNMKHLEMSGLIQVLTAREAKSFQAFVAVTVRYFVHTRVNVNNIFSFVQHMYMMKSLAYAKLSDLMPE